jgi:FMN phosphatase YigB (HAD superfamily)
LTIRAVCFDVSGTLISDERFWNRLAAWLDLPPKTLFAALGSVIERGERNERVFDLFLPGRTFAGDDEVRAAAGIEPGFEPADLYPDSLRCLHTLREEGYGIGIAGNQPAWAEEGLKALGFSVDFMGASDRWGVKKPDPRFFQRIVEEAGVSANEVAYVGDRLDYDVLPALKAGLVSIFLKRSPWGIIESRRLDAKLAQAVIGNLDELPAALRLLDTPGL